MQRLKVVMSDKTAIFWSINLVLMLIAAVICFKNLANLRKTLYWLIFPNFISVFSKKLWAKDFENSFRFELFMVLSAILIGLNYLIFKFLVPAEI
jgi:hypothetical protein